MTVSVLEELRSAGLVAPESKDVTGKGRAWLRELEDLLEREITPAQTSLEELVLAFARVY